MENLKNESGRSMTEMLGSLAIIGVLSIGGIAGYSYAMDKYRANRTMNDVRLRGMDVLAQFDTTGTATLDGWKDEPTLYPISLEEGTIGIQVDKVPQRVCEMIAEGMEHSADIKFITSNEVSADCGDETTMVFYFDDEPTEGEGTVNEPVREQCGETLCEQCFTCDESTMTCVSIEETMIPNSLDDLRICTSNGYKSYCGLSAMYGGEDMECAELGSANCAGMGDSECVVYIDGICEPLDSTMYLSQGVGGFRCTKDGKEGYCYNGVCREIRPEEEACIGKENEATCEINGQTGMCFLGQCLSACSENGIKCDAAGEDGFCLEEVCVPLTNDGCNMDIPILSSILGTNLPVENGFTCDIDGKEGLCFGGVCTTTCTSDSDCINENLSYCVEGVCLACVQDSHCTNKALPACSNGKCVACTQDSHCGDPITEYCSLLNICEKCPSDTPYRVNGSCVECLDDSNCTEATKPHCGMTNACVQCISHNECGANQFCGDSGTSCTESHLGGMCKDLDYDSHTITYTNTSGVSKTETFYVAKDHMNWWDADTFCKKLGNKLGKSLSLITKDDITIDGGKDPSKYFFYTETVTDLGKKLYNLDYGAPITANVKDSCSTYRVFLISGEVKLANRSTATGHVICR